MKKSVFDKNTVNEQLVLLSSYLESQRSAKVTLLSYLEKVSVYINDVTITENTESLVSCLNNVQDIFDNIKNNIDKLIELKLFIENISKSSSLNVIDFEKYNNQIIELEENIKTTNTSYNSFMESLTSIPSIDFGELTYTKIEPIIGETLNQEVPPHTPVVLEGIHSLEDFEEMIDNIEKENAEIIKEDSENSDSEDNTSTNETTSENNNINEDTIKNTESESNTDTEVSTPIDVAEENISVSTEETVASTDFIDSTNENVENNSKEESSLEESIEDNASIEESKKTDKESIQESNETKLLEKTLFINYESNFAILPYSLFDLEEAFSEHPENYSSINDIIKKEYTVSLDDYTNNSISRFKQTFRLAKEKTRLSFFESLSYANKLLFESEVETIIIAACESIHELDCYLECLNNDSISSFNCFKIISN